VEIAQRHADQIKLIVFEKNRGYGAAIKEGGGSRMLTSWAFWTLTGPVILIFLPPCAKLWNEINRTLPWAIECT
jgi:hypothetical protein